MFGRDKLPFDQRVAWVEQHMNHVTAVAKNPLEAPTPDGETGEDICHGRWWLNGEDPWQVLATCFELDAVTKSGNSEGFLSRLPVHQDGSCNGLQHYAALGLDKAGGEAVNLTPSDKPQDVYSGVLSIVLEVIAEDAKEERAEKARLKAEIATKEANGLEVTEEERLLANSRDKATKLEGNVFRKVLASSTF